MNERIKEPQSKQEPVAWSHRRMRNLIKHWAFACDWGNLTEREIDDLELIIIAVLNAAPVRTKDLTDDEIDEIESEILMGGGEYIDVIRAVIAADREKNK